MLVHIFGAKDSANCVIYALQRTARDNCADFDSITFETMLKSFYMDDCLKSVEDVDTMIRLATQLIEMCKRGGFRLTKFLSNSKAVLDSLPASELSPTAILNLDGEGVERALGVHWDTANDMIIFSVQLKDAPYTKRGIARTASSIFDPMGFLIPFILRAKLLLQELWRCGCDWDEVVGDKILSCWKKWLEGTQHIAKIRLPRCYNLCSEPVQEIQLHIFCDASELAYGAVAYLRFSYKTGGHNTSFVMAKSKLAPIKFITLPRLELNSAVTAVRLFRNVIREIALPIEGIFFWTDSVLVLQYITNKVHRPKVYVANRQNEILESSTEEQWRHVPGKTNPADVLTRGVYDPSALLHPSKEGTSWFKSAAFLEEEECSWPTLSFDTLSENDPEVRKKTFLVALGIIEKKRIDTARYSTWTTLLRTIAWILRFVTNSQAQVPHRNRSPTLSCSELHTAEIWIVKDTQGPVFQDDLHAIKQGKELPRTSKLKALNPFINDSGVLCVGGRLKNALLPTQTKHQVILPKNHAVTTLLIRREHIVNGHIGPEHVLSNLRQAYWVLSGRSAVQSVIRRCFFCQVRKAQKMYPMMADLPAGRVTCDEPPFTHCGVDLCGHFLIRQGRKRLKRWVVIFTCLSVRCVYLDVVDSADTDAFIGCLRRFSNRRGCPQAMYSDRGSNFVGATNELREFITNLDHEKIQRFTSAINIEWNFNPPSAPHMSGSWERLVKSTKEVLVGIMNDKAVMRDKVVTNPELYTLVTEVERILNSRPLTHVSDNIDDFEALTPNHLRQIQIVVVP